MPQEHHVLKCFSCGTFQVHIVKKARKWDCKICGTKQSLKRNFGKGSGQECRKQVMKLNELRMLKGDSSKSMEEDGTPEENFRDELKEPNLGEHKSLKSKWTEYLDDNIANEGSESEDDATDCLDEAVEKKKRAKKIPKNSLKRKKTCRDFTNELSFDGCDKVNHLLLAQISEDTFKSHKKDEVENERKSPGETRIEKEKSKKYSAEVKSKLKHSKYNKYLDDDEDDDDDDDENEVNQVNKSSNIFSSDLVDLDNLLNFFC